MDEHATVIDTGMLGTPAITGAFLLRGRKTALVETGPQSTLDNVCSGLARAGVEDLDLIIVTHVHLDHAGAAGALARRFPNATVLVHEIGAPHLVDPSKLWSSATRIYGDAMQEMWGGIEPIPQEQVRPLSDGEAIDLGDRTLRAVATPGHASHHHAYLDEVSGTVYAGDALGVRLPGISFVRPATPPPEFDLEAALASIERIKDLQPSSIVLTHFGPSDAGGAALEPDEVCDRAADALIRWVEWTRAARAEDGDLDATIARVERSARSDLEASLDEAAIERLERTTTYRMNTWGVMRYLEKREAVPAR